jgi:putative membrane protein
LNAFLLALAHPSHELTAGAAGSIWRRWTFEPGVVASLLIAALLYGGGVWRLWKSAGTGKGISHGQVAAFAAGWFTLVAALVSPIDALSDQLLSAHMIQHELLMIVAAPLFAMSAPLVAFTWLFRRRLRAVSSRGRARAFWTFHLFDFIIAPAFVFLLHAAALWIWHLPLLYNAALEDDGIHVAQHICFFVSACLFWWGMLYGRYGRLGYGAAVIYIFATAMHSGVLGALLTIARYPWYADYLKTTPAWGYSPLEDQQIAGLIMWVPAIIVFLIAGLAFLAAWLRESERRVRVVQTRA